MTFPRQLSYEERQLRASIAGHANAAKYGPLEIAAAATLAARASKLAASALGRSTLLGYASSQTPNLDAAKAGAADVLAMLDTIPRQVQAEEVERRLAHLVAANKARVALGKSRANPAGFESVILGPSANQINKGQAFTDASPKQLAGAGFMAGQTSSASTARDKIANALVQDIVAIVQRALASL